MHSLSSHTALPRTEMPAWVVFDEHALRRPAGHLLWSVDRGSIGIHACDREPMPSIRTLTPLVALGLTLPGCRKTEPEPVPLEAELRGAAHIARDGTQIFDARRAPVIALIGGPDREVEVRHGDRTLDVATRRRDALAILTLKAPEAAATDALCVHADRARRCWPVRFEPDPHQSEELSALTRLALAPFEDRLRHLSGAARIWGHQQYARRLARLGRTGDAVDAWSKAAESAAAEARPIEARRSLRAAAYMAMDAARYGDARALLDRALEVVGHPATPDDRLLDRYYRAAIDYALSRYRQATVELHDIAEDAWRAGYDNTFGFASDLLGVVLVDQGRISEAKETADDPRLAELASQRASDERAIFLSNRAWIGLMSVAAGGEDLATIERAVADLTTALELAERTREQRFIRTNLAWAHLLRGDTTSARSLIDAIPVDAGEPDVELMRGEIALRQSRLDDAAAAFTRAAATLERTAAGLPTDNTWRAAYGLGRIAAARGDRTTALTHYRAALTALDAVAARAGVWHARARFYADRRPLVDDTVRLLLDAGSTAEAFAVVDAANARALRALEARTRLDRLPAAVRSAWEQHRARFAAARREWDAARDEGELLGPEQKAKWQAAQDARQKQMVAAFEAAEALLTREAPARVAPTDAAAITAALPPKSALLAFGRIGETVHGFWLAPGHPVEHRALDGQPTAATLVDAFADALPGVSHLYVVPGDVPAARELATVERDGAPLGTRLSLSDLAYAGLLLRPRSTPTRPALVVADPTIDLPHALTEGQAVAAKLPDARLLTRAEATREAVRAAMAGAWAMHYAGHGVARAESPWQAHLALAGETTLTVADILTADVPAGTVVLSGCKTGVRGALSSREALGLADAFVAAGSRAVLATRRNIPDAAAARFIARFHAEGGLERPGAALRATTAAFHRSGDPIWSAFRLTGHP